MEAAGRTDANGARCRSPSRPRDQPAAHAPSSENEQINGHPDSQGYGCVHFTWNAPGFPGRGPHQEDSRQRNLGSAITPKQIQSAHTRQRPCRGLVKEVYLPADGCTALLVAMSCLQLPPRDAAKFKLEHYRLASVAQTAQLPPLRKATQAARRRRRGATESQGVFRPGSKTSRQNRAAGNSLAVTEVNMISEHCATSAAAPAATISTTPEALGTPPTAAETCGCTGCACQLACEECRRTRSGRRCSAERGVGTTAEAVAKPAAAPTPPTRAALLSRARLHPQLRATRPRKLTARRLYLLQNPPGGASTLMLVRIVVVLLLQA